MSKTPLANFKPRPNPISMMDGVKNMVRTAVKTTLMIAFLAISTETLAQQDDHSETTQEYQVVSNGYYANPNYVLPGNREPCLGCYRSNCGRGITSYEAVDLWRGYCNEDCSMDRHRQDSGIGHCGPGCGSLLAHLHSFGRCRSCRGVPETIKYGNPICPGGCDR